MQLNKASGPKDQQATNPQRENKQGHGKVAKSKQTSIERGTNHEKCQIKNEHAQRR